MSTTELSAKRDSYLIGVDMASGKDHSVMTTYHRCKSNGNFAMIKAPYAKKQHPNQQGGLDSYVDVLDHHTGHVNSVKLYENKRGLHFKKNGTHYLADFTHEAVYIPYQTRIIYDVSKAKAHVDLVWSALQTIVSVDYVTVKPVPHVSALSTDECAMTRAAFTGILPTMAYLNNTLVPYYTYELTMGEQCVRVNIHLPTGTLDITHVNRNRMLCAALECDDDLLLPTLVRYINDIDERFILDTAFKAYAHQVTLDE